MVLSKATEFFGSLGLKAIKRSASSLNMEDGKGHVAVTITSGSETEVDIVTDAYDAEVKAFLQRIG
jgi:hypothetical protein